jgi:trimeric autotransporter adhesin
MTRLFLLRVIMTGFVLCISLQARAQASASKEEKGVARLSAGVQAAISATLGRDDRSYHAARVPGGFRASNSRHDLRIDFSRRGVAVGSGPDQVAFKLRKAGYGDALSPVQAAAPRREANRIEYRRGRLTEWYVNGPLGLEQGFTLTSPPARRAAGPLTLALSVSGNLDASVDEGSRGLALARRRSPALRYGGLTATDAAGRGLPARLELAKGTLLVRVDDAQARYPVVIDPFLFKATLFPSNFDEIQLCCSFGTAVAVSGDTIVIGAQNLGSGLPGLAYIFVKPASGWTGNLNETAKLVPSVRETADHFGASVAIDGDTVIVGSPLKNVRPNIDQGRAYVFLKPAGGWTGTLTENAELTASDGSANDEFGSSAAVNGNTVVVGASGYDGFKAIGQQLFLVVDQGAAYVFVKPGSGWTGVLTESAKLTASDRATGDHFGQSVAVSGDTVGVGAANHEVGTNAAQGAAYVFLEPAGGWAGTPTENAELTAPGGAGDAFGTSVATNGGTVFVGAPGHDFFALLDAGVAFVFVEPVGGWTGEPPPTAILLASDAHAGQGFGKTVNASGNEVLVSHFVGQPNNVYRFAKPAGGWVTTNNPTEMFDVEDGSLQFFGFSGNTIVTGSDDLNYAKVYVRSYVILQFNLSLLEKIFNAGSTIPVKFQLGDGSGRPIPDAEAEALASACDVQIFFSGGDRAPGCARFDEGLFHFNLKTAKELSPGTYEITVKVFAGGALAASETVDVQIGRSR